MGNVACSWDEFCSRFDYGRSDVIVLSCLGGRSFHQQRVELKHMVLLRMLWAAEGDPSCSEQLWDKKNIIYSSWVDSGGYLNIFLSSDMLTCSKYTNSKTSWTHSQHLYQGSQTRSFSCCEISPIKYKGCSSCFWPYKLRLLLEIIRQFSWKV